MKLNVVLQIPLKLVCVQCDAEIVSTIGSNIAQCMKCGFKVKIESGPLMPAATPYIPTGKAPSKGEFRRPNPLA